MKPNGKYFAVHAVLFVLYAAGLFLNLANAQTAHGKFKLTTETRWGKLLLAPGEYEFSFTEEAGTMVTIRSKASGWSGMIMPASISDPAATEGTSLKLGQCDYGTCVQSIALGDLSMRLNFGAPKTRKATRLVLPQSLEVASVSGSR